MKVFLISLPDRRVGVSISIGTGLKLVLSSLDAGGSFRRSSCCGAAAGLEIKSGVGLATTPVAAASAAAVAGAAVEAAPVFSLFDDTRGDGLDLRLLSRGLLINPASLDVITLGVDALSADVEGALGGVEVLWIDEVALAEAVFISRCLASLESYFPAKKKYLMVYFYLGSAFVILIIQIKSLISKRPGLD
jgi:hypothetical protein